MKGWLALFIGHEKDFQMDAFGSKGMRNSLAVEHNFFWDA